MTFLLIYYLLVWIPCGAFASKVALGKGYNRKNWFLAGLFFGPIGLLAAAGLSDMRSQTYLYQIGTAQGAIQEEKTTSTRREINERF